MSKINVFHRYKWTLEEKLTLSIPAIVLLALTVYNLVQNSSIPPLLIVFDVVWVLTSCLLINIGMSKKKNSRLEAIFDEDELFVSVEGNKLYKHGTNKGNLDKFTTVLFKKVGQNPTIILRSDDQDVRNLNIPLRIVSKQPFYDFMVKHVLENKNIRKAEPEEIENFFKEAKTYKR